MYSYLVYLTYYALQERYEMARKMVAYKDSPHESKEQYGVQNSPNFIVTLRSLKKEISTRKAGNDQLIQTQEKQTEVNDGLLQSL